MSKISVIIPAYNAEKTISGCLESIINQTFSDLEIIVINDGSTDNTYEILRSFEKKDSRIKIIDQENRGASAARNNGISNSGSDYIMFVDSDDDINTHICEKLIGSINKTGYKTAVCGMDLLYIKNGRLKHKEHLEPDIFHNINSRKEFLETWNHMCSKRIYMSPVAKLYSSEIIKKNHIEFNEQMTIQEDLLFNMNYFLFDQKIAVCNESLYSYYIKGCNTLSKSFGIERQDNTDFVLKEYLKFWKKMNEDQNILQAASCLYFKNTMILIEKYINDRTTVRKIFDRVNSNENVSVLYSRKYSKNIEGRIYISVFSSQKLFIVILLAKTRLLLKKIIRG